MALGGWLYLLAGLVFVIGLVYSTRHQRGGKRVLSLATTLVLTAVVGWFATIVNVVGLE